MKIKYELLRTYGKIEKGTIYRKNNYYHDEYCTDLLVYGFPLDFVENSPDIFKKIIEYEVGDWVKCNNSHSSGINVPKYLEVLQIAGIETGGWLGFDKYRFSGDKSKLNHCDPTYFDFIPATPEEIEAQKNKSVFEQTMEAIHKETLKHELDNRCKGMHRSIDTFKDAWLKKLEEQK